MKLINDIKNKYPTAFVLFYKSLVVFLSTASFLVGLFAFEFTTGIKTSSVFQFLQLDHITLLVAFVSGSGLILSGLYMLASPAKKGVTWTASRDYSPLLSGFAVIFTVIGGIFLFVLQRLGNPSEDESNDSLGKLGEVSFDYDGSYGELVPDKDGDLVINANFKEIDV